jgi:hypothetical protein
MTLYEHYFDDLIFVLKDNGTFSNVIRSELPQLWYVLNFYIFRELVFTMLRIERV